MDSYVDPTPALGHRLPAPLLRDLMLAPPVLTVKQAAQYLNLSVSRVRALMRARKLTGIPATKGGSQRCCVPRSAVLAYWEERYLESLVDQQKASRL